MLRRAASTLLAIAACTACALGLGLAWAAAGPAPAGTPRPELVGEGVISTPDDEQGAAFSADGRTVYFTLRSPTTNTTPLTVLCVSHLAHGRWSEPQVLPFSGRFNDASPALSPDGAHLVFASDRPVPGEPRRKEPNVDLWIVDRTAQGFSAPRHLEAPISSPAIEQSASIAADGTLYFSSGRAEKSGEELHLYRARPKGGGYAEAEPLSALDGPGKDMQPAIAADQSFLVFASTGRPGELRGQGAPYARADLYVSFRTAAGWSAPRSLGPAVNSPAIESYPSLSPDGRWLAFTSDRGFAQIPMPRRFTASELMAALRGTRNGWGNVYRIPADFIRTLRGAETGTAETPTPPSTVTPAPLPGSFCDAATQLPAQRSTAPPPYASRTPITEPRLFAPGTISTPADEFGGQFTADGRALFFNRSVPRSQLYTIFLSRFVGDRFRAAEVAPFSGQWRDFDPVLAADGSRLFFISDRPRDGRPSATYGIWYLDRTQDGWSAPKAIGSPVADVGSAHFACTTKDGALYFTASRPGERNRVDVFRAPSEGGRYLRPEALGPTINGPGWVSYEAYVAPDESFLLVSAYGHDADSYGDADLFVSYRRNGVWGRLQNLGPKINSAARDYSPRLSPDGRYLFFASERGLPTDPRDRPWTYRDFTARTRGTLNGLGNLYQVDLAAALPKPEG